MANCLPSIAPRLRAGEELLSALILVVGTFSWGCTGVVSGPSSQPAPPPPTYSISGTISPAAGGSGATVSLSGAASATITANSSGVYTFAGLANGTYMVTPSQAGYNFTPTNQGVTVNGASVSGINFTATAQPNTFSISGTITPTAGGSGATVMLSGPAAATTTTDSAGNYSFAGLTNGTYTVTPSLTGYAFSPVSQSVTVSGASQTGVNFTATPQQSHTVSLLWTASTTTTVTGYNVYRSTTNGSSYVKINSSLVTSLTYADSTVLNGTTYYYVTTAVDSTGAESSYSNQATAVIP
jgi:Carboxypeptidase regulatory-like domain